MDTPQLDTSPAPPLLGRGKSLVAGPGLAAAAIVLFTLAGSGWWTLRTSRQSQRDAREQTMRASAQFLGAAAEHMIENGDLSQLRTLVAGATASNRFQSVRITLPDPASTVIAESSPVEGFKFPDLPEKWTNLAARAPIPTLDTTRDGRARITIPIDVPSRGPAVIEIEDAPPLTVWTDWRNQLGVAAIGVASLLAVLGFSRAIRTRFRALGAIRESLAAMQAGDNDPAALAVAPSFGPEAEAWNRLLTERAEMLARAARAGAERKLGDRRSGHDSDLFSLCDAMWQGLILVDDRMRVKYVNGAGAVFLRAKREEMVGRDASGFITDPKVLAALKALTSGTGRGRTVVEVDADKAPAANAKLDAGTSGSVFRYSMRPVRKEDNAAALIVIEDITQQRVAEEARHSFVASATHELRTPLTNMRLYIDSLIDEPDQDVQKRTEAVNVLSHEVRRLERLVGDMLSVAQIESGTLRVNRGDVRLEPIFEELKADFAEQARQKEITLRFDLPPKWPRMEGDRDKIVMALHNLVGNAIKYTPAGGEVVVRAGGGDDKTFTCDIVDNGIGIKDEEQTLVFEKFYRAKDKRLAGVTGTGLGLAIAREVVRLHGGDISLKSTLDKGSTFTMTLPAVAA